MANCPWATGRDTVDSDDYRVAFGKHVIVTSDEDRDVLVGMELQEFDDIPCAQAGDRSRSAKTRRAWLAERSGAVGLPKARALGESSTLPVWAL
ncbi:hypothetical protein FHS00_002892 [Limimaricola variabilis]|uniref:Uncharacterized protein n=1 Tax=Limimaricola variabilis TaxID=1492771 RepID=A0ABR6HRU9_9RHOB|nr:hypothetical protein [Limimaricola variabilis]